MPTYEELLYDRIAANSRSFHRQYAMLERGAWGERVYDVGNWNNSQNFTGKIVKTNGQKSAEVKKIGFFHPMYCGYAPKGTVVEIQENINPALDDDYMAIGVGIQLIAGRNACYDPNPTVMPCDPQPGCSEKHVYAGAFPSYGAAPALGSEESVAFYDKDTMHHVMGPNEIPAKLSLPGYTGAPPARPNYDRQVYLSWEPNHGAFRPTFQICKEMQCDPEHSAGPPVGDHVPYWPAPDHGPQDCCGMIKSWQDLYGPDWCRIVAQKIRNGEIVLSGGLYGCQPLGDWIVGNC